MSAGFRKILDTSALLAILFNEPDAALYAKTIAEAETCRLSAATFVEAVIVVETQTKHVGASQCDAFFRRAGITIEPVTEE